MESKKTKILYMVTKGNMGGAQRYVYDLATNLNKKDFDITVAVGAGNELVKKLSDAGIKTIRFGLLQRNINPFKDIATFFTIISVLRRERPDILHLNSSKIGAMGALAGRIVGIKKVIFTGHGWAFNEDRNIFSRLIILFIHWLTIILCHKTIAVSERIKNQILLFPFSENKIVQIYNGIEDISFLSRDASQKELAPECSQQIWIGSVSELHKNKGLDFLIQAYASVSKDYPDTAVIIIGEGEERKNLEKLAKSLNLENKVYLVGFKPNAEKFLKAFDILTLTSRTEAFPYVVLEAGLAGLPIIASRVGGIPEVISNKENGMLIEPKNVFDIEYSLHELLQGEVKRKILGERLKKDIETKFKLNTMIEKTVALYK